MRNILNERGFSLTELMIAMTILAVGLLALAQMQIMALQGTASSREFSKATNLARSAAEQTKIPGIYVILGATVNLRGENNILTDYNSGNNGASHAPSITTDTDITALGFDMIEVLEEDTANNTFTSRCGPQKHPASCTTEINNEDWDFVRIVNVRNLPLGSSMNNSIMKDINVIVLWKDRSSTRSVNVRTIVARRDDDFF